MSLIMKVMMVFDDDDNDDDDACDSRENVFNGKCKEEITCRERCTKW